MAVIKIRNYSGYPSKSAQLPYDVNNVLSPRIVGGEDAPERYAKHMVALVLIGYVKMLSCGGSIIGKRHVLTAAHCIDPYVIWGELSPQLKGVVGSNYWNSTNYIEFTDYIIHPEYGWTSFTNDIGLLITADKIVYSKFVGPIALNYDFIDGAVRSFVTGWGRLEANGEVPHRLQLLYLNTMSHIQCVWAFISVGFPSTVDPELEICTLHSKGHGMCFGDSGSALVDAASRKLIGIVSWGYPCAVGFPDVFVRISAFEKFLRDALGKYVEH
ncbi:unnamed protein product [Euphydryas editha]|uniref:Peptidase S1 domain-containing protein n=1 Tax=Euphydryas editha TaxID=104508 RepID=A0AAU9TVZ1_EUPED|nr:unnamed protein product [Euphydryas editha]